MPNKKYQSQPVALAEADRQALAKLAEELQKTKGEIARDAIRWYVQNHETLKESERTDRIASVIFKCTDRIIAVVSKSTNRICSLLVRAILDSNITLMLLYRLLPEEHKDDISAKMYRMAVTRVTRKLRPEELDIARMLQEGLDQEAQPGTRSTAA
jgi:hypothetical protein